MSGATMRRRPAAGGCLHWEASTFVFCPAFTNAVFWSLGWCLKERQWARPGKKTQKRGFATLRHLGSLAFGSLILAIVSWHGHWMRSVLRGSLCILCSCRNGSMLQGAVAEVVHACVGCIVLLQDRALYTHVLANQQCSSTNIPGSRKNGTTDTLWVSGISRLPLGASEGQQESGPACHLLHSGLLHLVLRATRSACLASAESNSEPLHCL